MSIDDQLRALIDQAQSVGDTGMASYLGAWLGARKIDRAEGNASHEAQATRPTACNDLLFAIHPRVLVMREWSAQRRETDYPIGKLLGPDGEMAFPDARED